MSATTGVRGGAPLHPLHAILLGCPVPLFLGALLSDWAYGQTYQIQWANFSSWLIAGGLLASVPAVLWALVRLFRAPAAERGRRGLHVLALLLMSVVGIINAFIHAKDAWATMPEGLYLSAVMVLLAVIAAWLGYAPRATAASRGAIAR
ncbi:MAG: DUF2231 domain-containing protein [Roseococcus sp.]|nr:DUF2231 domain-containing protein [Roseococcus sp.]